MLPKLKKKGILDDKTIFFSKQTNEICWKGFEVIINEFFCRNGFFFFVFTLSFKLDWEAIFQKMRIFRGVIFVKCAKQYSKDLYMIFLEKSIENMFFHWRFFFAPGVHIFEYFSDFWFFFQVLIDLKICNIYICRIYDSKVQVFSFKMVGSPCSYDNY